MAIKTQGTTLYFVDPADNSIVTVGCPTSISGINAARDQIETTCLSSNAREFVAGLGSPGAKTFNINVSPSDPSHVRLHELYVAGTSLNWALGWSDGTADPTVDSDGEIVPAAARSWLTYDGYVSDFPFDFPLNAVVTSTVSVQISGFPVLTPKSA